MIWKAFWKYSTLCSSTSTFRPQACLWSIELNCELRGPSDLAIFETEWYGTANHTYLDEYGLHRVVEHRWPQITLEWLVPFSCSHYMNKEGMLYFGLEVQRYRRNSHCREKTFFTHPYSQSVLQFLQLLQNPAIIGGFLLGHEKNDFHCSSKCL